MGTRALVHVKDDETPETTLITIYRQYDGYPEGLGKEIIEKFANHQITNGISLNRPNPESFSNGMGEFAADLLYFLKESHPSGNIYVFPPDCSDVGEEYTYTITQTDDGFLAMECVNCSGKTLFKGKMQNLNTDLLEETNW